MAEPLAELGRLAGLAAGDVRRRAGGRDRCSARSPRCSTTQRGVPTGGGFLRSRAVATRRRAPARAWGDPDLPLVYVTFGSVTGSLGPFDGVFREALDGLADLDARVLMTVGRRFDADDLRPWPANAHVEQWWPQDAVLAHAAAMLGHGGFGTTMGALAGGVPQVVAPIFTSDQVVNGRHVAAVGAGIAVEPWARRRSRGRRPRCRACSTTRRTPSGRAPSPPRSPRCRTPSMPCRASTGRAPRRLTGVEAASAPVIATP